MKTTFIGTILALSLLCVISGCGKSSPVAGTWVVEKYVFAGKPDDTKVGKETVLTSDGKVSGFTGEGTYMFKDNVVTCSVRKGPAAFTVTMKYEGGKLIVENPASTIIFKKK